MLLCRRSGRRQKWMAHLTQLLFVWIAILAMTSLTIRLGWDRWHATASALLLVAIPPSYPWRAQLCRIFSQRPSALVAMERIAAWKAEQKWSQGAAAALALGLAGFARPHLVLLLPLAAFFLLDSVNPKEILAKVRRRPWLWTPVIAGCVLLAAIILAVREHNLAIGAPAVLVGHKYIVGILWRTCCISCSRFR